MAGPFNYQNLVGGAVAQGGQWLWNNAGNLADIYDAYGEAKRVFGKAAKANPVIRRGMAIRRAYRSRLVRRLSGRSRSAPARGRRSRSAPRRRKSAVHRRRLPGKRRSSVAIRAPRGSRRIASDTRASIPRKVGRDWPPEVVRRQVSTMTIFDMNQEINNVTCGACFYLSTRLTMATMTHWSAGDASGTKAVRATSLPRNWTQFSTLFDRYRIMRVRHFVKMTMAPSSVTSDHVVGILQTSIGHRDQPFIHPPPDTDLGTSAPFDTLNLYSQKLENYRHCRKFRLQSNSAHKSDINFMVQPYIFKDNFGQKVIGGKQKDGAEGPGIAISNLIGTTNVDSGLCGEVYVYTWPLNHKRIGSHVNINCRVRTVFDIEFYDRKINSSIQTGGLGFP